MSIQEHLNKIRNAIYGREVRESIAKGIETAYDDASEKDNANMEVKLARGTNPNLNTRLNKMDETDRHNNEKIDSNYNKVAAQLDQKATKTELQSVASGSPKGVYATLPALQDAFPNGDSHIYVVLADGNWYYWSDTMWIAGGVYQGMSIADGTVTTSKISPDGLNPTTVQGVNTIQVPSNINLFNKETTKNNGYYGTTGSWINDVTYVSSDFIPVTEGNTYDFTAPSYVVKWDSNKRFVAGGHAGSVLISESNVAYITVSVLVENVNAFMVYPQGDVNLFNKSTLRSGGYYGTTGSWVDDGNYVSSDFIPVTKDTLYEFTAPSYVVKWDSNKQFVAGGSTSRVFIAESNVAYITVRVLVENVNTFMVYPVPEYTSYYKDTYTFDDSWDVLNSVEFEPTKIQGVNKTQIPSNINLFNKETTKNNGYYDTTGTWVNDDTYVSSDFIPVTEGSTYNFTSTSYVVRWNSNKRFVSGGSTSSVFIGENVAYITVSVLVEDVSDFMVYVPGDRNLFDKSTLISGGYYGTTGKWVDNATYVSSDFIPVTKGKTYYFTAPSYVVKWDSNKQFITGGSTSSVFIDENVAYITVRVLVENVSDYVVYLIPEYTSYYKDVYTFDDTWDVLNGVEFDSEKITDLESEMSEFAKHISPVYTEPIELVLNDFSGYNQPFHPSVLYINGGFNGYKYWLVQSPYPVGGLPYIDRWEVPVVYKSNDGIEWEVVANPLDDLTPSEIENKDYMSDPHLVYREDNQTLEVWYRLTNRAGSTSYTKILRKTSTNGTDWSTREEMIGGMLPTAPHFVRSHSVLWDNTNKEYRLWYTNNHGVYYNTISDGGVFEGSSQQLVTLSDIDNYWHIDVNYYNNQYHFLGYDTFAYNIVHYTSDDGLNFTRDRELLSVNDGNPLYSRSLYRACSLVNEYGDIMLYFSTVTSFNETRIGLIIAKSFSEMQGVRRLKGRNVVLENGFSLEELAEEVFRLKGIMDAK